MWYRHIRNIVITANPHTFITTSGMLKGTTDHKIKILCNYGHFYTEVKISFSSFWMHSLIHWWLARPVTVSPQFLLGHLSFQGSTTYHSNRLSPTQWFPLPQHECWGQTLGGRIMRRKTQTPKMKFLCKVRGCITCNWIHYKNIRNKLKTIP